jgi:hypothetical protein
MVTGPCAAPSTLTWVATNLSIAPPFQLSCWVGQVCEMSLVVWPSRSSGSLYSRNGCR